MLKFLTNLREVKATELLEELYIGFCLVDKSHKFVFINQTFLEMMQYSSSEMLKRKPIDFLHPEDGTAYLESIDQIKTDSIKSFANYQRFLTKNGQTKWALVIVFPLRTHEIIGYAIQILEKNEVQVAIRESYSSDFFKRHFWTIVGGLFPVLGTIITGIAVFISHMNQVASLKQDLERVESVLTEYVKDELNKQKEIIQDQKQ